MAAGRLAGGLGTRCCFAPWEAPVAGITRSDRQRGARMPPRGFLRAGPSCGTADRAAAARRRGISRRNAGQRARPACPSRSQGIARARTVAWRLAISSRSYGREAPASSHRQPVSTCPADQAAMRVSGHATASTPRAVAPSALTPERVARCGPACRKSRRIALPAPRRRNSTPRLNSICSSHRRPASNFCLWLADLEPRLRGGRAKHPHRARRAPCLRHRDAAGPRLARTARSHADAGARGGGAGA